MGSEREMPKQTGAALCVGVSLYRDKQLAVLTSATSSARDVEKALGGVFTKGVRLLADPPSSGDVFLALQRAMQDSRGGTFLLYYAGHALRRGKDLLLAVGDSEVEGTKGCVPWSDIEELLGRERVKQAVILLNIDQPTDEPLAIEKDGVCVMGSVRVHERASANTKLRAYGEALLEALRRPAAELAPYLTDGKLDVRGVDRYLAERAPKTLGHRLVASGGEIELVFRDLTPDLARLSVAEAVPVAAPPVEAKEPAPAGAKEPAPAEAPPPEDEPAAEAPAEEPAAEAPPPAKKKAKKKAPLAPREEPSAEIVQAPAPAPSRLPIYLLVAAVVAVILYLVLGR